MVSCSKNDEPIYQTSKKINAYELYKEGLEAFEKKDYFFASKKFSEAELNFEKIESSIYQVKNQSGQDPLNFPIKVNNRLAYLRKSVESGDGLPTNGSIEVYELLKNELSDYIKELKKPVIPFEKKIINHNSLANRLQAIEEFKRLHGH